MQRFACSFFDDTQKVLILLPAQVEYQPGHRRQRQIHQQSVPDKPEAGKAAACQKAYQGGSQGEPNIPPLCAGRKDGGSKPAHHQHDQKGNDYTVQPCGQYNQAETPKENRETRGERSDPSAYSSGRTSRAVSEVTTPWMIQSCMTLTSRNAPPYRTEAPWGVCMLNPSLSALPEPGHCFLFLSV